MSDKHDLLKRMADALERLAPPPPEPVDWFASPAFVFGNGTVRGIDKLDAPPLDLLRGIGEQKERVVTNVMRLAQGHAAHDMLLWGSRGMGKSALLRSSVAAAQALHPGRIALAQVTHDALPGLTDLFATLGAQDRRFLVFVDDLGFEDEDGTGGMKPYLHVRGRLEALVNRAMMYELVKLGEEADVEGVAMFVLRSHGEVFPVMRMDRLERLMQ